MIWNFDRNALKETVGLFVGVLLLVAYWQCTSRSNRYDEGRLWGKTRAEVERLLDPPTSRVDDDLWIYQYGMDPDASVEFRDGKVVEVWSAKRRGFLK